MPYQMCYQENIQINVDSSNVNVSFQTLACSLNPLNTRNAVFESLPPRGLDTPPLVSQRVTGMPDTSTETREWRWTKERNAYTPLAMKAPSTPGMAPITGAESSDRGKKQD